MKRTILLAVIGLPVIFVLSSAAIRAQKVSLDPKVGIANSTADNKICFAIENKSLRRGQRVGVIFLDRPQKFRSATVLLKTSKSCSSDIDMSEGVSFYFLKMRPLDQPWVGIGVVEMRAPARSNGYFHSDINADGRQDYFRACTSNEGVHLTIWNGIPLKAKRIWHRYYYLKYDTEPDCKRKDYAGT